MKCVSVILDVRQCRLQLETAEQFALLWSKLERSLTSRNLTTNVAEHFDHPQNGRIGVLPIEVVESAEAIDHQFIIHSILKGVPVRYPCSVCKGQSDRLVNGPYHCASSAADGSLTWLCHEHAVHLSGTLQTYHPKRVPSCSSGSGQRADFWCMGVRCQPVGGRPWGRDQVAAGNGHGSPYVCRRCHHAANPVCAVAHCAQVAYQHCEYVDPVSMRACRQKLCSNHGYKWQIYGPEKEGLNLCPTHADLRTYSDEGIVEQMVLGTALRRRQQGRSHDALRVQLPTLLTTRHIFLNVRQVPYDLIELRTMFHAVADRCTAIDLRKRINRLLKLRRDTWDREAIKLQKRRKDALPFLKRVQAAYGSLGLDAVANSLRCADMIQLRSGQYPYRLLVYVAPGEIANFKGVGCGTLHRVEKLVGVELWLERDQQGQRRR